LFSNDQVILLKLSKQALKNKHKTKG